MKLSIKDYDNDDLETFQRVRKAPKRVEQTVSEFEKERDLAFENARREKDIQG